MLGNVRLVIQLNVPKHLIHTRQKTTMSLSRVKVAFRRNGDRLSACLPDLHANDGVDEEEHGDEQADIGQSLEGLDEGPQEDADGVALSQQFDETSCSEQLQETHVELINRLAPGQKEGEGKLVFTGGVVYEITPIDCLCVLVSEA